MFQPRLSYALLIAIAGLMCISAGCSSLWGKKDEDESDAALRELMKSPPPPDLVREAAVSQGLYMIQTDGVGAVEQLAGTGGPADPSFYRDELIAEMQRHDIPDPNNFLESKSNALVRVRALIPPGARRGDPIDLKVLAPKESQVSDLGGGWLLDTRLRRQIQTSRRVSKGSVHSGVVLAIGAGPVVTRASHQPGDDIANRIEGNVISGGRVQESRKLGLVLRPGYQHVKISSALAEAVSKRFYFFDGSTRRGVATAKEDDLIDVELHPRYRDNVYRYMEVVRAIGVEPESTKTQARLIQLADMLAQPSTSADAALQLEAMGEGAVPTLIEGVKSTNPEVRFYAAEALAYLDRDEAISPLEHAIRSEAAFRLPALIALQGLKSYESLEALKRLLHEPSLETRYGAFVSIRRRRDGKPQLGGQSLGSFWLYRVPSSGPPAVVISLRESPEVVVFGDVPTLQLEKFLRGPAGILVQADETEGIKISRFEIGKDDQRVRVSNKVADTIVGLSQVGAGYGEVIEILRMAKDTDALKAQLAVDPLPRSQRKYYRDLTDATQDDDE
ncbi:flagellar basal body P-ring protein [Rubripirellula amarantea]|uniref:Flagellar basal body P-ring protein n=1 Tax=Rubripirellula amarantea TaxID=2527999 RepID=A0A5C5WK40_9BACT|nr:flagellar basal body P-ring protein FlgI [Rubripirellula amarantea]TWT50333.1 flagellar basal body P-ring protein [Rubripirellula amarantea]